MTIEDAQSIIRERTPEILNIGDYESRVKKCIEILKTTHLEKDIYYTKQESDDVVEMLDTFLIENEAYGFMKEHNLEAFGMANSILRMCKCCLFYNPYSKDIPLGYATYIHSDHKVSLMGIEIGNNLSVAKDSLNRYGARFNDSGKQITLDNHLVDEDRSLRFSLNINHQDNKVSSFYLEASNSPIRWEALSGIDRLFKNCSYKLERISREEIIQRYDTYYDIADVRLCGREIYIRIVSKKQFDKEHKLWWKI